MAYAIGEFIGTIIAYGLFVVPIVSAVLIVKNRKKGGEKRKRFIRYRLNSKGKKLVYGIILPVTIIGICLSTDTSTPQSKSKSTTKKEVTTNKVETPKKSTVVDGFDINDVKIEFTEKGSAILTNNSKYPTTELMFIYDNGNGGEYYLATSKSLKPGGSQTISARNYVRDGGYELIEILVCYVDDNGETKDVIYDPVLGKSKY